MKNKQFIILAVVCVVTLLPFMGLTDFHTKGEPREAIVAYSMIETGNWTLPVNNGGGHRLQAALVSLVYCRPFLYCRESNGIHFTYALCIGTDSYGVRRILILRQTQGSFSRPPYGLNYPV